MCNYHSCVLLLDLPYQSKIILEEYSTKIEMIKVLDENFEG